MALAPLFTAAGVYHDEGSDAPCFGILATESGQLIIRRKSKKLFPQVRQIGHVYRIEPDFRKLVLEIVSEEAELAGIEAPNQVDLCANWQAGLKAAAEERGLA